MLKYNNKHDFNKDYITVYELLGKNGWKSLNMAKTGGIGSRYSKEFKKKIIN
ncbi:hypothetical protein M0Q97_10080 [Candidatus Dojkabacteria bacterium]|jgi:hypothetical protein|nr:hypothetical protein [Candidatus Dojkabacteria bacterium]